MITELRLQGSLITIYADSALLNRRICPAISSLDEAYFYLTHEENDNQERLGPEALFVVPSAFDAPTRAFVAAIEQVFELDGFGGNVVFSDRMQRFDSSALERFTLALIEVCAALLFDLLAHAHERQSPRCDASS